MFRTSGRICTPLTRLLYVVLVIVLPFKGKQVDSLVSAEFVVILIDG